jgi:type I restriction enzyme S subunit
MNLTPYKLGDICRMKYGKIPPSNVVADEGYPIFSGYRITGCAKEYLYDEPRVIVVARGVGGTGDVKMSPEKSWITNLSIVLDHDEGIVDKKFLLYRLGREPLKEKLNTGAAQAQITIDSLSAYSITLPPVEAQRRIACIITAYDDLIENNRRRIQLLEQAARLLYKEWFVHLRFPGHEHTQIIDGVPEGWEKKTAFEVMDVLSGGTPKTTNPSYWDGHIPFFTPKDATDFAYAHDTEKSITEAGLKNCNSNLYPKDTVFITARGTVGKINLAQCPMAMNQSCYALVAHPPLNQHFLYFALVDGVEQFRSRAVGAVFDAIVRDTFKLIPFVVPDEKLITAFMEHVSPMLAQIDNLSGQVRSLRKARDLLLPKLMNGEVAV